MGMFDWFGRSQAETIGPVVRDAGDDRWFSGSSTASNIGVNVTVERARQVPVVCSCLKVLADSVAGLQFGVFSRSEVDEAVRVPGHSVLELLQNPNPQQTSFDFLYTMVDDLQASGDFFAEVKSDGAQVVEARRLDPCRVIVEEIADGTKRFRYRGRSGQERILLEDEVWHIPRPPTLDGLTGRSPILHDGREAVAVAIALQRYANSLFVNDATPPYALAMPAGQSFKDADSKKSFLAAWRRWSTGPNRHVPAILEYGIEPKRMGLTAEEAQFLETRKELWLDLTRIWRVPPHKIGIMDRATFSNIEHQSLEFVTDTLRPILEMIERSITKFLIDEPGHYFEFDVSSLLRGDIKSRYEAYALGRQWGWLSVNDILRRENANGIGRAGDRYIEPLNMVPVGADASSRDPQGGVQKAVAFLRESVARNGGRPRLEVIRNVA